MKEKISVIVPIYNVEKYLDKCILSIINQTYPNIEIILIDDGSSDSSSAICDVWSNRDSRIIVKHKTNGGLSDARNCGIEMATGEYLCFIDSDDTIEPTFIEILWKSLKKTNSDIAICSYNIVVGKKNSNNKNYKIKEKIETYTREEAIKLLFNSNSFGDYAWNKLYKKNIFNLVRYPIGRKMEDIGTTYLLFDKCNKIVFINIPLYNYLQRDGSILHNLDRKYHIDKYSLCFERYKFLKINYPNITENLLFFAYIIIADYPYLLLEDKEKARDELKILWPLVKNKMKIRYRIKGIFLFLYPKIYEKMFFK